MKFALVAILFLAACSSGPNEEPIPVGEDNVHLLDRYAEAAWRAHKTMTHADDTHPRALREMETIEAELGHRCATPEGRDGVRWALDERVGRYDHARQVAQPGEMERAEFKWRTLTDLRPRLGL